MIAVQPRITFVHAPNILYDQNYGTYFAPLWIYTLAAYLPANWCIAVHECPIDGVEVIPAAEVYAFSGINQDLPTIRSAWESLKRHDSDALCIIGGPITWSLNEEGKLGLLDFFDHIFILDGEAALPRFLDAYVDGRLGEVPKVIKAERFDLQGTKRIDFELIRARAKHYYGAVIEVSRGCPYLCEFCDIRVLPDNNRSAGKPVSLVIEELDEYYRLGISQFQFACDNFIGDKKWAAELVDAILDWKENTGATISIFTWLSIDLFRMPKLMAKMRRAGFSILFIGIESVNHNSLLEAAKLQNTKVLRKAVLTIQSFGFIIVPGFIFGFDSDSDTVFDDTLAFIAENGLIGGDPSFLMALPGTPLYRKMQNSGRLVNRDVVTVRRKIETNIRYLHDTGFLINGFMAFIRVYCSASFQFRRFQRHLEIVAESPRLVESDDIGYGSPLKYLALQIGSLGNLRMLWRRFFFLMRKPGNLLAVLRGWWLVRRLSRQRRGLAIHFHYWLYVWTNIALKYQDLTADDFLFSSVDQGFEPGSDRLGYPSPGEGGEESPMDRAVPANGGKWVRR